MMAIAVICLTIGHPMFFFAPMMRQSKASGHEKELASSGEEGEDHWHNGSYVL